MEKEKIISVVVVGHDMGSKSQVANLIIGAERFKTMTRRLIVKTRKHKSMQGCVIHVCMTPNLSTPYWGDVGGSLLQRKNQNKLVFVYVFTQDGAIIDHEQSLMKLASDFGKDARIVKVLHGNCESTEMIKQTLFLSGLSKNALEERKELMEEIFKEIEVPTVDSIYRACQLENTKCESDGKDTTSPTRREQAHKREKTAQAIATADDRTSQTDEQDLAATPKKLKTIATSDDRTSRTDEQDLAATPKKLKRYKSVIDILTMELKTKLDPALILDGLKKHEIGSDYDYIYIQEEKYSLNKIDRMLQLVKSRGFDVYKKFKVILLESGYKELLCRINEKEIEILSRDEEEEKSEQARQDNFDDINDELVNTSLGSGISSASIDDEFPVFEKHGGSVKSVDADGMLIYDMTNQDHPADQEVEKSDKAWQEKCDVRDDERANTILVTGLSPASDDDKVLEFEKHGESVKSVDADDAETEKSDMARQESFDAIDDDRTNTNFVSGLSPYSADDKFLEQEKRLLQSIEENGVKRTGQNESDGRSVQIQRPKLTTENWELYSETLKYGNALSDHIRVNIVGHQCVGKTTLLHRLLNANLPSEIVCTEGLEVNRVTSRCTEVKGQRIWESNEEGYETELNVHRMATAIKDAENRNQAKDKTIMKNDEIKVATTEDFDIGSEMTDEIDSKIKKPLELDITDKKRSYLEKVVGYLQNYPEQRMYVSFWDFAGQAAYYSTHQAFLSPSSVYLLLTDLSQNLDDEIVDNLDFNIDGGGKRLTVFDALRFWMDSIRTYTVGSNGSHAPVILIGTHRDKVEKKKAEKTLQIICRRLAADIPAIDIDNTIPVNGDAKLKTLKDLIVDAGTGIKEQPLPAQWINLERLLIDEQSKLHTVMDFESLKAIDGSTDFPLCDDAKLREFLDFQHCRGNLIFFNSKELENVIILDPTFLVRFLNLLLRNKSDNMQRLYQRVSVTGFCSEGIFDKHYVEDILQKNPDSEITDNLDLLLKYIVKLHIAFPLSHYEEFIRKNIYFMPCLLKEAPEYVRQAKKVSEHTTSTIIINFGTRTAPPAIFHRLISNCLWDHLEPEKDSDGSIRIFCGYACFNLTKKKLEWLELSWKNSKIHITARNFYEKRRLADIGCDRVLQRIQRLLDEILEIYRHDIQYELCSVCPEHGNVEQPVLLSVTEMLRNEAVLCKASRPPHSVTSKHVSVWFPKMVDNPGLANAYLTIPTDKDIGRLARYLGGKTAGLAAHLKLHDSRLLVEQAETEYPDQISLQRFRILMEWKNRNRSITLDDLKRAMTKRRWCPEEQFDGAIAGEACSGNYDLPEETLERNPTEKEIDLISGSIGAETEFFFLEMGLQYVAIQQEKANHLGNIHQIISNLLLQCTREFPKEASIRRILNCADVLKHNVKSITESLKRLK